MKEQFQHMFLSSEPGNKTRRKKTEIYMIPHDTFSSFNCLRLRSNCVDQINKQNRNVFVLPFVLSPVFLFCVVKSGGGPKVEVQVRIITSEGVEICHSKFFPHVRHLIVCGNLVVLVHDLVKQRRKLVVENRNDSGLLVRYSSTSLTVCRIC